MNLVLNKKLVDVRTGAIVGLLYQDVEAPFMRLVPFKLDVAKSLGLQDADIAEFLEVDTCDVVIFKDSYALISNVLYELDDKTVPFEKDGDKIIIFGYVFDRFSLINFITSLEEADYGEDKLC